MCAAIAGVSAQHSRGLASRNRTQKRRRPVLGERGHTMANCTYSPSSSENARWCASSDCAACMVSSMLSQSVPSRTCVQFTATSDQTDKFDFAQQRTSTGERQQEFLLKSLVQT
jgi:hypothetical protein